MKRLTHTLMIAALGMPAAGTALTLAERGKPPEYAIVLPAEASPSQQYAAEELRRFTEQMTGVTLPITTDTAPLPPKAILLGTTQYTAQIVGSADCAPLGDDGFTLKTSGDHLCIIGSRVRGTLYGVYELLEKHGGCRWYSSWHSHIPQTDKWQIPELNETHTPAFAVREPFWYDMFSGDFAARSRCNGNRHELSERHGGKIRFGSGMFVHTFNSLCPPERYFDEHPEYFSLVNGKRLREHTQLCLTNPEVLRIVTEATLERIRKDPAAGIFSVSQNDWRNPCECPACKAVDEREGSHAGTMITFVNQVAEAVEREFPAVWIETLAYQYTRKPPKSVRPRRNVAPRLCTIECDFSLPLETSAFKENRAFLEDMQGWSAIAPQLYLWDYTTDFRCYILPFPNVHALQQNVKFFRANRVSYLFEQGAYQGQHGEFAELKAWLLAKWLWNPELDQESLLQDFFSGYYGAAAPYVRTYFDALHSFYRDSENRPLRIFDGIKDLAIPDNFFDRAAVLWRHAEDAVKEEPSFSYNVRMGALPVLYAQLARGPRQEGIRAWVAEDITPYRLDPATQRLAAELLARFTEAGNIRLSESQPAHDALLASWRELADPPPMPGPQTRAVVEDTLLTLGRRGEWGDTVADPLAEDGSAMKLYNTHYEWCTTLPLRQVAFDAGCRYRIRMRVRVEKIAGREGEAFWSGVYDQRAKKGHGGCTRTTQEIGGDYAWHTVAEWIPESDHYLWIGPGRFDKPEGSSAIKALYIDKIEIEKLK